MVLARVLALCALLSPAAAEEPPAPRPPALSAGSVTAAAPPAPRPQPDGSVCGDPALLGTPQPPIAEAGECGVAAPVLLSSAAGVLLEPPAVVACATARALADWIEAGPSPLFAARGEALRAVHVVDAYSCRNRNRAAKGKLSEHAVGNAIDISGFALADGAVVSVLDGWASEADGAVLRAIQSVGCGPFGTVLGPEANALHADHLHFDVAARRSGPYCE